MPIVLPSIPPPSPGPPVPRISPTTVVIVLSDGDAPRTDYVVGNLMRARVTLRDQATGVLVDPDNLAFKARQGGAAASTYTYGVDSIVVKVAVGVYDLLLALTLSGKVAVRTYATGSRPHNAVAYAIAYDPNF